MSHFSYPRRKRVRLFWRNMIRMAIFSLTDFRVIGVENIPKASRAIIVANHFHYADPVAVIRVLPWQTEYIAGTFRPNAPPITRWLPDSYGTINVHRGAVSLDAMRQATHVLAQNGLVMIFPEAGAWADVLRPARPGTALLAVQSGAPVIPIGIDGMTGVFKEARPTVTIRIGRPIGPFATTQKGRKKRAELEAIGEKIMRSIADQLPPERHGVYASDPVLRAAAEKVAAYPFHDLHETGNSKKG